MHREKGNTVGTAHWDYQNALGEVPHERVLPGSGKMVQKSNYRTKKNVFSGQNAACGILPGSLLESVLLISDLEEILIGKLCNLEVSGPNADDQQLQKDMEN